MKSASHLIFVIGSLLVGLLGGVPASTAAADPRVLGETATRLPRGRLATSLEGGHSCVVVADGTVKCWGLNGSGQLGDGTNSTPTEPVRVNGITTAVAVATGRDHTCALLVDATVRCWGAGAAGQLGNGSFNPSFTPVAVRDLTNAVLTNAVSITAGSGHTCVRRSDGTVACWGLNENGQLGDDSITNRPLAVAAQDLVNARMVAAGGTHTCAVRADSTVACWGANGSGQLGLGHTFQRDVPQTVLGPDGAPLAGVWVVATGFRFTCALFGGFNTMRCWGRNDSAQLADDPRTSSPIPVLIPGSRGAVLALGFGHGCHLLGPSVVVCWGQNAAGQLGRGVAGDPRPFPDITGGGGLAAVEIAAGLDRTCALDARDVVFCWGENSAGQLAIGSAADALVPQAVQGLGGAVSARGVAAGLLHSCAWRADATVACWGRNAAAELGDGTLNERHAPVPVTPVTNALAVVGGDHHTCVARQGAESPFCWGRNVEGQVDPEDADDIIPAPVTPTPGSVTGGGNIGLAAGGRHSVLLRFFINNSGSTTNLAWGGNDFLQLGAFQEPISNVYFHTEPLPEVVAVVAGLNHTCALQPRGTVVCWGSNVFGQLGNTSTFAVPTGVPQLVEDIVDAVAIGAGQFHTCAVLVNGTVRCWGRNDFRQLGDGTQTTRRTPVPADVAVGTAVGVVAGRTYTCILTATGRVQCWGGNGNGELGDSSFVDRPSPVFVRRATFVDPRTGFPQGTVNLSEAVALVGGDRHACAVRVNGQPVCWGNNDNGQIGDGFTTDRAVAKGVPSFLANIAPAGEVNRNGRHAEVTALVNCPEGAHFRVRVRVEQDGAEGHGHAVGKCDGGLARIPVKVSAQGRARFDEGAAEASAVIEVRLKGELIDHQEWGRVVNLESGP